MIHALRRFLFGSLGFAAGCSTSGLSSIVSTDPGPAPLLPAPSGDNVIPVHTTTVGLVSTIDGVELLTMRTVTATAPGPRSDGTQACRTTLDCSSGSTCVKQSVDGEGTCLAGACACGKGVSAESTPVSKPRHPYDYVAPPHPLSRVDTVCARVQSQLLIDPTVDLRPGPPAHASPAPAPTFVVDCVPADGKAFKYETTSGGSRCDSGDPIRVEGELRNGKWVRTTYWAGVERPRHMCGRPLLVEGEATFAEGGRANAWAAAVDGSQPSPQWSETLRAIAFEEHASIAAFSRTMLQLVALGAPPELLAETTSALGEEIEHARQAFALADRFGSPGERSVEPAAFPAALAPLGSVDALHAALLVDVVVGGCIGEAVAVLEAHELRQCAPAEACSFFSMVIEDEARHAALAWKTARWLIGERPELAELAVTTLRERSRALEPAVRAMLTELSDVAFAA